MISDDVKVVQYESEGDRESIDDQGAEDLSGDDLEALRDSKKIRPNQWWETCLYSRTWHFFLKWGGFDGHSKALMVASTSMPCLQVNNELKILLWLCTLGNPTPFLHEYIGCQSWRFSRRLIKWYWQWWHLKIIYCPVRTVFARSAWGMFVQLIYLFLLSLSRLRTGTVPWVNLL